MDLAKQPVVLALLQHEKLVKVGELDMRKGHKVDPKQLEDDHFGDG